MLRLLPIYMLKVFDEILVFSYFLIKFNFIAAKPIFEFTKKLPVKCETFRTKPLLLDCFVNHPECHPIWYRNGIEIKVN